MTDNNLFEIPNDLLCVSWILAAAVKNVDEVRANGFVNTNFNVDYTQELAKQHKYFYKRK